jgi:hypothetical protein
MLLLRGTSPPEPEQDGPFTPLAFRAVLVLSMVLTLADATILSVMAMGTLDPRLAMVALVLVVIAEGLYRLRVWALFLTWLANPLVVAGVIGLGTTIQASPGTPKDLSIMYGQTLGHGMLLLIATTLVQLVLPIPVVEAMIRGRVVVRPRLARVLRGLVPFVLWVAVGGAVAGAGYLCVRGPTSVFDDPCRGFVAPTETLPDLRPACFVRAEWIDRQPGGVCTEHCLGQDDIRRRVLFENPSARAPVPSPCPDGPPRAGCRLIAHCYNGSSCLCVEECPDHTWKGLGAPDWVIALSSLAIITR